MLGSELLCTFRLRVSLTAFKLWCSGDAHDNTPRAMMIRVMLLEDDEEEDDMIVDYSIVYFDRTVCRR